MDPILVAYRNWLTEKRIDFHFQWFSSKGYYGGWVEGSNMPIIYSERTDEIMTLFFNSTKGKKIYVNRGPSITEEVMVPDFFKEQECLPSKKATSETKLLSA